MAAFVANTLDTEEANVDQQAQSHASLSLPASGDRESNSGGSQASFVPLDRPSGAQNSPDSSATIKHWLILSD